MLDGDGGRDVLRGRGGADELDDGDRSGHADRDLLHAGRGGDDLVHYDERTAGIDIDLERTNGQGERGEDDALEGVEDVVSGAGRDVLRGNAADNDLNARAGRGDVTIGRGGDDELWNSQRSVGGAGNDTIIAGERGARVSCGAGTDLVTQMHSRTSFFGSACEQLDLFGVEGGFRSLTTLASAGDPIGRGDVYCGSRRTCTLTLSIYRGGPDGERIGHAATSIPPQRVVRLRPRLSKHGRELLERHRHLRVALAARLVEPKSSLGPQRVELDGFATVLHLRRQGR
jgi:hypothetical protein